MKGKANIGFTLEFGEFGLKSLDRGWLSSRQIEAARKTISHHTKRMAKLWIRVFPDKAVSKKASGAKMGGGKGDVDHYVVVIKPGRIIFELAGVEEVLAKEAIKRASAKLPFKTKFIKKE